MTVLSTFVGHSFMDSDEQVVTSVLRMLDSIALLMPDFTWDHAQAAEPKILSVKVREKMQDKNLFIGICTARERAFELTKGTKRRWPHSKELSVSEDECSIKPSDWVIQEIGMAIGRNMDVILLLEEGVRRPGGLQGDLEYISFSRQRPESCFEKLVEMLRTLSPREQISRSSPEQIATTTNAPAQIPEDRFGQQTTPNAAWTAAQYISGVRIAIALHDSDAEHRIVEAFSYSLYAEDESVRAAFEAGRTRTRSMVYKDQSTESFASLIRKFPKQAAPLNAAAQFYKSLGEFAGAARYFESEAAVSGQPAKRVRSLIEAASCWLKDGDIVKAEELASACNSIIIENPTVEAEGFASLAEFWKERGVEDLFFACAERAVQVKPDSYTPGFSLAHTYSERGLEGHAIYHYKQLLAARNDSSAENNLGVSRAAVGLPVLAMDAYRSAHEGAETLATSNLASAKLKAGFADEAIRLCKEKLTADDTHARLAEVMTQAQQVRPAEEKREVDLLAATTGRRTYLREFAVASIDKSPPALVAHWKGPKCSFLAATDGRTVELTGAYTRPKPQMLADVLLGKPHSARQDDTVSVTFSGRLYGRAVIGTLKEEVIGASPSLLGTVGLEKQCMMILTTGSKTLRVLEKASSKDSAEEIYEIVSASSQP